MGGWSGSRMQAKKKVTWARTEVPTGNDRNWSNSNVPELIIARGLNQEKGGVAENSDGSSCPGVWRVDKGTKTKTLFFWRE